MFRFRKIIFTPIDALLLLIAFHFFANIIWIKLNNAPPTWDQAAHTRMAFRFAHYYRDFLEGTSTVQQFMTPFTDQYAPFAKLIISFVLFLFGFELKLAQSAASLFFLGTLISIYLLGKELFHNKWIGVFAAAIFSFFQAIYETSRGLFLDVPMTFFLTMMTYCLVKSEFFKDKRYTYATFIFLAMAMLTKIQAFMYTPLIFLYALYILLKEKRYGDIKHIVVGGTIWALIFMMWFIPSLDHIRGYLTTGSTAESTDPVILTEIVTWLHYLKLFINQIITFIGFVGLVLVIWAYRGVESRYKWHVVIQVLAMYVLFTIFPNKDARFLFPFMPYVAMIYAACLYVVLKRMPTLGYPLVGGLFFFHIISYLILSFSWPVKGTLNSFVNLPLITDVTLLNFGPYPVYAYNTSRWPYAELIQDVVNQSQEQPMKLVFIPNYDQFNDNTFNMFLSIYDVRNIEIIRAEGRFKFESEAEVEEYVNRFQYFIMTPNEVGVFYQLDKVAFEQIQGYVMRLQQEGQFMVIKEYTLPTGQRIQFLKRRS